jgi:hypothetical protein
MFSQWTYQLADFPCDDWHTYSQELKAFWMENSKNLVLEKAQFFVVPIINNKNDFQLICPTLYSVLKEKNILEFITAIAFLVVPPDQKTAVHTDSGTQRIALNLPVLNCDQSYTVWYKTTNKLLAGPEVAYVKDNSLLSAEAFDNYLDYDSDYYEFDSAEEIDRVECNRPLWINFKIPHRPEVNHSNLRILASFRFTTDFPDNIINENIANR